MTTGAYRDGLEATLEVLERLDAEAARREERLDARTRRFLGEDAQRLEESRRRVDALSDEGAEPLARVKALEHHLSLLEEVLARLPALDRVLATARPGFPKLAMFEMYRPVERFSNMPMWVGSTFRNVERFIIQFDLDFTAWALNTPNVRGFKVEFHHEEVPYVLGCEKEVASSSATVMREQSVLATTVPRGTPELAVVPEKLRDTLFLKPLGLVDDLHVGDDRFDHEFLVQAEDELDLDVLGEGVREGMMLLKETESPRLLVERGDAAIHWFSEPTHALIRLAMTTLRALRSD